MKTEKFATTHPRLNREDQERPEVWNLSTGASIKKALLLVAGQSTASFIADNGTTHQLHHIHGKWQSPIANCDFKGMAEDDKLPGSGRWSYGLKAFIPKRSNVLLAQTDHHPVSEIMAAQNVDALYLLDRAALEGRDFSLIALQKLAERCAFEDFCVRSSTECVNLGFKIARTLRLRTWCRRTCSEVSCLAVALEPASAP